MSFSKKSKFSKMICFLVIGLLLAGFTTACTSAESFENQLIFKAENMSNVSTTEFDVPIGNYSLLFFYQMGKHETGKNYYPYSVELNVKEDGIYTCKIGSKNIETILFSVPDKETDLKPIKILDDSLRMNKVYDTWNSIEPKSITGEITQKLSLTFPYNNSCWYLFENPVIVYSDIDVIEDIEENESVDSISFEFLVLGEDEIEVILQEKEGEEYTQKIEMDLNDKTKLSETNNPDSQELFYKNKFENVPEGEYLIEVFAKASGFDEKIKVHSEEITIENKVNAEKKHMPSSVESKASVVFKSENMTNTTSTDLKLNYGTYEFLFYYQMGKYETGKSYYPYSMTVEVNESGVFSNDFLFEVPDKDTVIKTKKSADERQRFNRVFDVLKNTETENTISENSKDIVLTYPYNNSCWYVFETPSLLYSDLIYEKIDESENSDYNIKVEVLVLGDKETKISIGDQEKALLPKDKKILSETNELDAAPLFYNIEFKNVPAGKNKFKIESTSYKDEKVVLADEELIISKGSYSGSAIDSEKNIVIISGCTYQIAAVDNYIKNGFEQDHENLIHLSHYQTTMYDIAAEPLYSELKRDMEKADIVYINMINTSVKGPAVLEAYKEAKEKNPNHKPIIIVSNLTDTLFEKKLEENIPESFNIDAYKVDLYSYFSNTGYDQTNLEHMIYKLLNDFRDCNFKVKPSNALPDNAIYHPDYEKIVFKTQKEYLKWYENRTDGHKYNPENGTVGIMFYSSYYPGKIEPVDDTIRELENLGLNVIPIYLYSSTATKVCPEYFKSEAGNGEVLVDVVISLSRYLSEPPFDEEEFDVPIINGAVTKLNKTDSEKSQNPYNQWMNRYYRPETSGMIDPINLGYTEMIEGVETYISESDQIKYLAERTNGYIKLKKLENKDKRVAIVYYNHDGGKDSIGASYLDVPASLSSFLKTMKENEYNIDEKYSSDTEDQSMDKVLIDSMLTYGYNIGNWAPGQLKAMVETGKIAMVPSEVYEKWFEEFFGNDPNKEEHMNQVIETWGEAPGNLMTYEMNGKDYIIIPLVDVSSKDSKSGSVIMAPQPSRGRFSDYDILYHDGSLVPNHQYIAFYSWLSHSEEEGGFGADVIVYMGRHGTQEWLPGKETGLSRYDWPPLMHSDIPIVYYYVVDGISEGIQAKRRGNAVVVDHLTPAIVSADLSGEYSEIGDMIVNYRNAIKNNLDQQLTEGYKEALLKKADELNMNNLIKVDPEAVKDNPEEFEEYLEELNEMLYLIKTSTMPYGLHILGTSPEGNALISTIHAMLGQSYVNDLEKIIKKNNVEDDIEVVSAKLLNSVVIENEDLRSSLNEVFGSVENQDFEKLKQYFENAEKYSRGFKDSEHETEQLLRGMNSGFIGPGVAGDPIVKPHILPTGYNFQTIDSTRVPSEVSQKLGQKLGEEILDKYKKEGDYPESIAYVLWASETVRHEGVMEASILYLMGVEYDFSTSSSPTDKNLRAIEGFEHPTMNVVMQISGLYRDMFPDLIQRLDDAVVFAATVDNPNGNKLKENIEKTKIEIMSENPSLGEDDAYKMSSIRIFGPAPENYGTGMSNTAIASDTWDDRSKLGDFYIENMGHCYANRSIGPENVAIWGLGTAEMERAATGSSIHNRSDLYKLAIKDVEVTFHSRSTNLYGVIDNDDFYQYLGGLNLAVATLNSGEYPDSFIMDLKKPGAEKVTDLKKYLEDELLTRNFNPNWTEGMMKHGYAGAREMGDFVENLWGWEAMMPDVVSNAAWDGVYNVYVKNGEVYDFLNSNKNSYSLQSITSRLLEAARTDNWNPTDKQLKDIVQKQVESIVQNGPACCHHTCGNPLADEFISGLMSQLNVVDKDTASKYQEIMKELKEPKVDKEKEPKTEKPKSSSSTTIGEVSIKPSDEGDTIPIEIKENKTNVTDSTKVSKQDETTGEGAGKDPGTQAGKQVTGVAMVQKTVNSATKQIMDFLENPTFSSASFFAVLLIVLVVGIVFYGYRKKDL